MANFNFNKVILGGRLTADPELKTTQSGIAVVSFSIAVNRRYKNAAQQTEADFFNVTAWRSTAELVARYFRKGSSICVVGTIQNSTWTDQQNVKHRHIPTRNCHIYQAKSSRAEANQQSTTERRHVIAPRKNG